MTHDSIALECISWPREKSLENLIEKHRNLILTAAFVIVDEAQFLTGLLAFSQKILEMSKTLVLVGLNGDYLQRPFLDSISGRPEFAECLSLCNHVELLHSLCDECGDGQFA